MLTIPLEQMILVMVAGIFIFGCIAFVSGFIILITRTMGKDIKSITKQTAKLTQKGLTEEIAGLVGNASSLLNATSEMVRTSAGVGVFLVFIGLVLMAISLSILFIIR